MLNRKKSTKGISVVVAIRNGESSIDNLIDTLSKQNYKGPIEFILVDDNSNDRTKDIINKASISDSRFKYVSSNEGNKSLKFKKKALDIGIKNSQYEYLLFTDVDCKIQSSWVSKMSEYFNSGYNYLVGYSLTNRTELSNYITSFQRLDLMFLMIMCRGSSYIGSPWACTGQNQGFSKELYNKVGGFEKIKKFIGDDTPFLQYCSTRDAKVAFVDSNSSLILSREETKLSRFLIQRARWAFDANQIWRVNIKFYILLVIVSSFYLLLLFSIIFSLINLKNLIAILYLKFILEFSVLYIGSIIFSYRIRIKEFLVWQLFHIPYVITVGFISYFTNYLSWKGRRLSL